MKQTNSFFTSIRPRPATSKKKSIAEIAESKIDHNASTATKEDKETSGKIESELNLENPRNYDEIDTVVRSKSARHKKQEANESPNQILSPNPHSQNSLLGKKHPFNFEDIFGTKEEKEKTKKKLDKLFSPQKEGFGKYMKKANRKESLQETLNSVFHSVLLKSNAENEKRKSQSNIFFEEESKTQKNQPKKKAIVKSFLNSPEETKRHIGLGPNPSSSPGSPILHQNSSNSFFITGKLVTPNSHNQSKSQVDPSPLIPSKSMTIDSSSKKSPVFMMDGVSSCQMKNQRTNHSRPQSGTFSGAIERNNSACFKIKKSKPILPEALNEILRRNDASNGQLQENPSDGSLFDRRFCMTNDAPNQINVAKNSVLLTQCFTHDSQSGSTAKKPKEGLTIRRKSTVLTPSKHNIFRFK